MHRKGKIIEEILKLEGITQKKWAAKVGCSAQLIGSIKKNKQDITKDIYLYIINNYPALAVKYEIIDKNIFNNDGNNKSDSEIIKYLEAENKRLEKLLFKLVEQIGNKKE